MPSKKISQLDPANAALTDVLPASNAAGTATSKVTVASILSQVPAATTSARGTVQIGSGLTITNGVLSAAGGGSSEDSLLRSVFSHAAPTTLSATGVSQSVILNWVAPSATYRPPVTDYLIQYKEQSATEWTTFSDGTSTATTATVPNLTNGTAYVFRVAAVNAVGTGAFATSSSASPNNTILIPTMTSNTAPSGVASAAALGGTANFGYEPYYAFDGDNSTWVSLNSSNDGVYLQYAFSEGVTSQVGGYSLRNGGTYSAPNSWDFLGSNDGVTWTTIHEKRTQASLWGNQEWNAADHVRTINFYLDSPVQYRMFRWTFSAFYNGSINIAAAQLLP